MWGKLRPLAVIGLGLLSASALAEPSTICADRPGKATATCTVPEGRWQSETGVADWSLQKHGDERETDLVLGETTLKYGTSGSADIEVDVVPFERSTSRSGNVHQSASGFGDLNLIYKQAIVSGDGPLQVSLRPFVKIPTAPRSLGNGKFEGGLLVPIGYSLGNSRLNLALTPEIDLVADSDRHGYHAQMAQVASLGWQVSDQLTLSAEIWGDWDWDPSGTTRQYSADGSIAFLPKKNLQLDGGANFGLNRDTPDLELYGGIAILF
jgi:hypothetical protein